MKLFKYALALFISISIVSCGSDDDSPSYELSTANIAGTHEMIAYESDSSTATIFNGSPTVLESKTIEGETFTSATLAFSTSSYTLTGSYVQKTETVTTEETTNESAVKILNESGTFSLDTDDKTITFNGEELNGKYDVDTFTSSKLVISQLGDEKIDAEGFTITTNTTITFER